MKLWQKDTTALSQLTENFTVGRDREFDLLLARYDVQGSIAHVTMLSECGLMSSEEALSAIDGLKEIADAIEAGTFVIEDGVEDVHSQVEFLLTQKIGEAGKKFIVDGAGMTRLPWISNSISVPPSWILRTMLKNYSGSYNCRVRHIRMFCYPAIRTCRLQCPRPLACGWEAMQKAW